jgi:hypothetical protein
MMNNLSLKSSSFASRFRRRYRLRWHMTLLLLATVSSGLLATRIMLALHLNNVMVRYPLAVAFAYLLFFVWVKLWLKFLVPTPVSRTGREASGSWLDGFGGSSSSGSSGGSGKGFGGGGGNFGGAGATGSFAESAAVLTEGTAAEAAAAGSETGSAAASAAGDAVGDAASALDVDDPKGCLVALALLAIAALICGAGIYLVYQAPFILSEAAFQALLAGGLARRARRIEQGDWLGSVFRATWIPFALTLLLSLLAGGLIHHFFPEVTRISELFIQLIK